jgi:hypothetical protein
LIINLSLLCFKWYMFWASCTKCKSCCIIVIWAGKWINVRKNRSCNQEWASQRHWQHEGAIKNGQARDTGNTKGQSRMGKPETLATLGTQDTRRRKTKHKNTPQKRWAKRTPPINGVEPRCSGRISSSCLLWDTSHLMYTVRTYLTPLCANKHN